MDVTIFIRTKNEACYIERCLTAIFSQQTSHRFEVIILDSGSSDATIEKARAFPVEIYSIPSGLFHFSSALNFGVRQAYGKFFVALSAHAIPADDHWLEPLLKACKEPNVVASFSRHIPWPEASWPELRALQKSFPESVSNATREGYDSLFFSNVSSCILRTFALDTPFRLLPFSEDRAFALDCLIKNKKFVYVPDSKVHHLHDPHRQQFAEVSFRAETARRTLEYALYSILGHSRPRSRSGFRLFAKLAVYPLWFLMMTIKALLLPARTARLREVRFYYASLGTLTGKIKAWVLSALNREKNLPGPAPIEKILEKVERLQ